MTTAFHLREALESGFSPVFIGLDANDLRVGFLGGGKPGRLTWGHFFDVRLVWADANTGGQMVWFDFNQRRDNLLAGLNHVGAARVEAATLRGIDG